MSSLNSTRNDYKTFIHFMKLTAQRIDPISCTKEKLLLFSAFFHNFITGLINHAVADMKKE